MKREESKLDDLEAFLISDSPPKKDVVKELRLQGANPQSLFDRVTRVVREGYSAQLKRLAEQEQSSRAPLSGLLAQLATMPRDAMLRIFERVSSGEYGTEYRAAALARCRNKDASDLTDEELRSWLEDIGEVLGEPGE